MAESVQKRLARVRSPRVHVTYDVETGGAIETKELPFVMGVLGDFSGQPVDPLPKLKDRRFVEVTLDNFDSVLESMKPHVAFSVDNKLSEDDDAGQLKVDLNFKSMDDFEPEKVARQVKPLRELLELRTRLSDLKGTLQTNDKLDEILLETVTNTDKLNKLRSEIGSKGRRKGGGQWLTKQKRPHNHRRPSRSVKRLFSIRLSRRGGWERTPPLGNAARVW